MGTKDFRKKKKIPHDEKFLTFPSVFKTFTEGLVWERLKTRPKKLAKSEPRSNRLKCACVGADAMTRRAMIAPNCSFGARWGSSIDCISDTGPEACESIPGCSKHCFR